MNQLLIEILFQCRRVVEVAAGMKLNLSKLDQVKMKYNSFGLGDSFATMDFADFIFFAEIANLVIESWRKFQNKRESKQKKICLNTECKETAKETKQIKIFFFKWKYAGVSFKWKDICLVERNVTLKIVHPYGVTLIFFLFFGRLSIQSLHYLSSMGHHVLDINFYCRNVCLRLTQHDSNARGRDYLNWGTHATTHFNSIISRDIEWLQIGVF